MESVSQKVFAIEPNSIVQHIFLSNKQSENKQEIQENKIENRK